MARSRKVREGAAAAAPNGRVSMIGSPVEKGSRVSVTPFAVLLPQLSNISALRDMRGAFENKLAEIRSTRSLDEKEEARLLSEESMLSQVLQWLTIAGEKDSAGNQKS